jgi:hypothetical protein
MYQRGSYQQSNPSHQWRGRGRGRGRGGRGGWRNNTTYTPAVGLAQPQQRDTRGSVGEDQYASTNPDSAVVSLVNIRMNGGIPDQAVLEPRKFRKVEEGFLASHFLL